MVGGNITKTLENVVIVSFIVVDKSNIIIVRQQMLFTFQILWLRNNESLLFERVFPRKAKVMTFTYFFLKGKNKELTYTRVPINWLDFQNWIWGLLYLKLIVLYLLLFAKMLIKDNLNWNYQLFRSVINIFKRFCIVKSDKNI